MKVPGSAERTGMHTYRTQNKGEAGAVTYVKDPFSAE